MRFEDVRIKTIRKELSMDEGIKHVFTMIEKEGEEKARWVKIGVGFVNKDDSINIYFDALPLNGKVNVRDPIKKTNGKENL